MAAVEPNALSGKYAFLSAYVVGDAAKRYQFSCEQNELSTEAGADFHLTVTDIGRIAGSINQIAKRANATGTVYRQDIEDIKKAVDEIWRLQRRTLLNQP